MTDPQKLPVEIITEPARLHVAIQAMAQSKIIAIDTESNSRHRYPEQLCLIQIATTERIFILDTIALKDVTPLQDVLADSSIKKVFHTADYDIRCIDRHGGLHMRNIYDTALAARFAGVTQFSLTALLKDQLGLSIEKSERLQRSDWGLRPLSTEAIEYAASDVRHLFALQQVLDKRLQALNRESWIAEEFSRLEDIRYSPPDPEAAFLSIKGANTLDGAGLAILQKLYFFRDREARRRRRPPFFIMPDTAMITLAANPTMNLTDVPGLSDLWAHQYEKILRQALYNGLNSPPIQPPVTPVVRETLEQLQRLSSLKAWRATFTENLTLDPSFIWPTLSLQRLAKAPDTFTTELGSVGIRRWQIKQFGESLRLCLEASRGSEARPET